MNAADASAQRISRGLAKFTIFVVFRNGAAVCSRSKIDEALDYARRCIGWDIHLGRDTYRTEFATVPVDYSIEEHAWDGEKYTSIDRRAVDKSEAISPLPTVSQ